MRPLSLRSCKWRWMVLGLLESLLARVSMRGQHRPVLFVPISPIQPAYDRSLAGGVEQPPVAARSPLAICWALLPCHTQRPLRPTGYGRELRPYLCLDHLVGGF